MAAVAPNRPLFFDGDMAPIKAGVEKILRGGMLSNGPLTRELEEAFARRVGTKYAIAVSSGTAALQIIFQWLHVYGRQVVVPSNTFVATPNAVIYAGGNPIFADCDPDTLCMDGQALRSAYQTSRVAIRAVCTVHIGGLIPPCIREIQDACGEVPLVEDAAHAHGASYTGLQAGRFGVAAAYSFYPTKVMTSGEGGMIVTDSSPLNDYARSVRDQGRSPEDGDKMNNMGHNWRMSEVHALLGLWQLKHLSEFIERRRKIAAIYDEELKDSPYFKPQVVPRRCMPSYYKYVVMLGDGINRDYLKAQLWKDSQIRLPGEVYRIPCHRQPIYAGMIGTSPDMRYKRTNQACDRQICLPIHAGMTVDDVALVIFALEKAVGGMMT